MLAVNDEGGVGGWVKSNYSKCGHGDQAYQQVPRKVHAPLFVGALRNREPAASTIQQLSTRTGWLHSWDRVARRCPAADASDTATA